ncbi:hypothetical protein JXO52_13200 [bacterium]|nr:hypothetical protein [bacterium]
MTTMYRMPGRRPLYRIRTDEPSVVLEIQRRPRFQKVSSEEQKNSLIIIHTYEKLFASDREALKTLRAITCEEIIEFDPENREYRTFDRSGDLDRGSDFWNTHPLTIQLSLFTVAISAKHKRRRRQ